MKDQGKTKKRLVEELDELRRRIAALEALESERRQAQDALGLSHRFLEIGNRHTEMSPLLAEFVTEVKGFTGCSAVGIRILDEEGNIPYESYVGFSRTFYESESPLSIKSDRCMCINVIKGETPPELPYYTAGGSLYVNGTTRFLATVSQEEKERTRNVCNEFGYESVALIPIRMGGQIIGLIHIADERENMVPTEMVAMLEEAAMELGPAIQRVRVEEGRLRLEMQMQHAQRMESLGVLAGGIAHDFNNLLVGVLGNAALALMDLPPESPARYSLEQIKKAAVRAAELCKQMLAYSGKGSFTIEALDLSELVGEMTHLLETSISKKAVLKYDLADNLPAIEGDPAQMTQVIMNLITNASEAIGETSGVIIAHTGVMEADRNYLSTTWADEDLPEGMYIYIEVSDTGCGMDEETKARIFDPFFTTKFTGRGLGLAAVLGIVRAHRGTIKVYSEPGRGTTFKVLFPVAEGASIERDREERAGTEGWRGSGTILVVDDEETVRAVAKITLERLGFTVLTARDGAEGVAVFRERAGEIAAVLLDLTMPHMGGEEAFTEMRRVRGDVRAILSSGYSEEDAVSRFAGKGLSGFIHKPYDPAALAAKLRELLEGR